jgi:chemotaxis protein histidine kinase CheA/CheY-like chemotaxis protein
MSSELDAELADIFRQEAVERLDQMDAGLLAVESGGGSGTDVDALFRHMHTIKGGAGMLGFDDIRALSHAAEDILASVREAGTFPPELAAPLLRATAVLRACVTGAPQPVGDAIADLTEAMAALSAAGPTPAGPGEPGADQPGPDGNRAEPAPAQAAGAEPDVAPDSAAPPRTTAPGTAGPATSAASSPAAGTSQARTSRAGSPPDPPAALAAKAGERPLRVPAEKIDRLLDVVGELTLFRGQTFHAMNAQGLQLSPEFADLLAGGGRMLNELRDTAIGMRTLPLTVITRRLPLAVRDIARETGKDVELIVTGADTELDRVILESLHDPLAHLLSNAVIHGIEPPAERERAGKPARGRLEVRAVPHGNLVEIVVSDDGRGISPEIRDQAAREGSLTEVLARPGYSTAPELTDRAGRGVGLDAVNGYARSLGGSLEVRSEPGQGMEIRLLLPLALALLEVLLFQRGRAAFGVPLSAVEEVVPVADTLTLEGRPALIVRGQALPVADVAELLGAAAPPLGAQPPALVISAGGRRAVAVCDAVLGEHEALVKSLGPLFDGIEGYLGCTILGDGRIALLVEPTVLTAGAARAMQMSAPPTTVSVATPRVLVVEDSFTVRELQRSILEAGGYPVVTARDGRDALEILHTDLDISLVMTDVDMPRLNGLDLTRAIRGIDRRASLPVIIVTSRGSEEDRRSGIEAGADAYMAKHDFSQQALLATVERLVGR